MALFAWSCCVVAMLKYMGSQEAPSAEMALANELQAIGRARPHGLSVICWCCPWRGYISISAL